MIRQFDRRTGGPTWEAGGGPPVEGGPEGGLRSCYFLTPWDMQMELITYPNGKAYEKDTEARLWDPRFPEK